MAIIITNKGSTGGSGSATDPTTTYLTATGTTAGWLFKITSGNATVGATYTNNGNTYTVLDTIVAGLFLATSGASAPLTSGTLTRATGTGDTTITFSLAQPMALYTAPTIPAPKYFEVEAVAGGGSGGYAINNPANPGGGGGGGGGTSRSQISAATFGLSRYYTIGGGGPATSSTVAPGGITSLETQVLATGGAPGAPGIGTNGMVAFGGWGGNTSYGQGVGIGDEVLGGGGGASGGPGIPGVAAGNGGNGGNSTAGGGGIGTSNTIGTNIPSVGTNYGGGGGGGAGGNNSGANGGGGRLKIKVFY